MTSPDPAAFVAENLEVEDVFRLHGGSSLDLADRAANWFSNEALNNGIIDTTITSPPYGDVIKYGEGGEGAIIDEEMIAEQIGFGDSFDKYRKRLRSVFRQTYSLTKPSGSLWIIVNSYRDEGVFVNIPSDIITLCQNLQNRGICPDCSKEQPLQFDNKRQRPVCSECGWDSARESWQLHDVLIWDKVRARPYPPEKGFRNVFEYILVFKKSEEFAADVNRIRIADPNEFSHWWVDWPERYHPRGIVPSTIWEAVTPSQGAWGSSSLDHPAPFPVKLIDRIVRFTTTAGDVVFDPFAGTGTAVAQADIMGRESFGIELVDEFRDRYKAVYDELKSKWDEKHEQGRSLEQQQRNLARVIWGLRELVYAKKLSLKLRRDLDADSVEELGLNSLFIISQPLEFNSEFAPESRSIKIVAATDAEGPTDKYEERLLSYRTGSPWRSFGITSEIDVKSLETGINVLRDEVDDRQLYLYPNSRHHSFARTITLEEWIDRVESPTWYDEQASLACPPLISTTRVEIDRSGDVPEVDYDLLGEPPDKPIKRDYTESISWETKQTSLDSF